MTDRLTWEDAAPPGVRRGRERRYSEIAERAHAHRTLEIPGASHAITVSHPRAVAHQILEAAAMRVTA